MLHLEAIKAAVKGKAPIVAIPVEGHAPVCVNRSLLAKWSKGVTILAVDVVVPPAQHYPEFVAPRGGYGGRIEGPWECNLITSQPARYLCIEGRAGNVKTRCTIIPIDRRIAVKTLAVWSQKEREKLLKKTMLGALSPDQKRAMKRAKHEIEGDGMVLVSLPYKTQVRGVNGKLEDKLTMRQTYGLPVTIAPLGDSFVVHRHVESDGTLAEGSWGVSERFTGLSAGFGATAEEAIIAARTNAAKATPAAMEKVRAQIAAAMFAVAA
jgi:hypothetical protein